MLIRVRTQVADAGPKALKPVGRGFKSVAAALKCVRSEARPRPTCSLPDLLEVRATTGEGRYSERRR